MHPRGWMQCTKQGSDFECEVCVQERARRRRVLPAEAKATGISSLTASLSSAQFKDSIYITRCNEPVGTYAMDRARLFAQTTCVQLLWIQAEDNLDDPHFADLSMAEKIKRKRPWLHSHFHTRRTGGVPSLLPLCYDLPMRCQFANYGGARHTCL